MLAEAFVALIAMVTIMIVTADDVKGLARRNHLRKRHR